ncbi:MAG: hypothetical protein A2014_08450 [Spirochaetes bacterium GWF1_49_6]|nr:MAG: hypothetical protein A2014_08450 [Spirochaetes bacterium GWF1_49_6]
MRRVWGILLVIIATVILPLVIGCGEKGVPDDAATLTLKKVYSWKTNEDFFALTNCFIYNSADSKNPMNGMVKLGKIWVIATRMGSVERVEIIKKFNDGNTANVMYSLYFKDGTTIQSNTALLIKIDGVWKLTVN